MIRTASIAAVLAALVSAPALASDLTSNVDAPKAPFRVSAADAASTQSAGTVGAMHVAVAGRATSLAEVQRESRYLLTAANGVWLAAQPAVQADASVAKPGS
ncbi:hypothetical protein ACFSCV_14505 [Methylopila henanensis]|uniref:Secreted protein n=1 Tax=Methylopila henanensis TaxID=873516 RepID=A0ABW4KAB7_9HYPH